MYPNPSSGMVHGSEHLRLFEFLGRILGKALYEGITVSHEDSRRNSCSMARPHHRFHPGKAHCCEHLFIFIRANSDRNGGWANGSKQETLLKQSGIGAHTHMAGVPEGFSRLSLGRNLNDYYDACIDLSPSKYRKPLQISNLGHVTGTGELRCPQPKALRHANPLRPFSCP